MTHSSRSLDNPINWSFPVGRLFGITIRLHLFFILGALWIFFDALKPTDGAGGTSLGTVFLYGLGVPALLFVIVLLHEFGHCFGARYTGGTADEVLLWPLGGLAFVHPHHTVSAHLVTVVCGPLVNVVFCALSSLALILWVGPLGAVPWNPFHPFTPSAGGIYYTPGQYWLAYFYGTNYVLLLFNLLPIFPFDGGRVFQCLAWPRLGYRSATMLASGVGMVGAIVMGLVGLLTANYLLVGLAFFGYLTCYQQRQMLKMGYGSENDLGYDFSQGYRSLDRGKKAHRPSYFARRRAARALAQEKREREAMATLQQRVDAILDKVHHHGIQSLTEYERRILSEATERQRAEEPPSRRS